MKTKCNSTNAKVTKDKAENNTKAENNSGTAAETAAFSLQLVFIYSAHVIAGSLTLMGLLVTLLTQFGYESSILL